MQLSFKKILKINKRFRNSN